MIYTIPKGKHRARPVKIGFGFTRKTTRWKVAFFPSCRYDLKSEDQEDINKLCGWAFVPWWKLLFIVAPLKLLGLLSNQHHKHSARFGWNYNKTTDLIQIYAYCYINKQPVRRLLYECKISKTYQLELTITKWSYHFYIRPADEMGKSHDMQIDHNHRLFFYYPLGFYFGGNRKAPHDIQAQIEEL